MDYCGALKTVPVGTLIVALSVLTGCRTSKPVAALDDAPRDQPIEIVTKGGTHYTFEFWVAGNRNEVMGFTRRGPFAMAPWKIVIVPRDSIGSISTVDTSPESAGKFAFTAVGVVGAVMFIWIVTRAISLFAGTGT